MAISTRIKLLSIAFLSVLTLSVSSVALFSTHAYADVGDDLCSGASIDLDGEGSCDEEGDATKVNDAIASVVNIFSVIIGVAAVIYIIYAGFKYVTSGGDSNKIGSAKSTIIYAVVGLIVVALAQVLVRFVITKST